MEQLTQRRPYHTDILVPPGWDEGWRAYKALALAGGFVLRVAAFGDSIAQGIGASSLTPASTLPSTSWAYRLRNKLVALYGLAGDHFGPYNSTDWIATYPGTPPWTVLSTGRTWLALGSLIAPGWISSSPANAASYVVPYATTQNDIWYRDATSGTPGWRWRIGAGANTNVNTTGAAYAKKTQIGAQAAAAVVNMDAMTNLAFVPIGITSWADTADGVLFAHCGSAASQLTLVGQEPMDFWGGKTSATVWDNQGAPTAPHLTVVCMGINDCTGLSVGAGPTQAAQAAKNFINHIRRARPDGAIVWILPNNPDPTTSDTGATAGISNPKDWTLFIDSIKEVCWQNRVAFIDAHDRWGEIPRTLGFNTSVSDLHPNDAGYGDIYTALESILL